MKVLLTLKRGSDVLLDAVPTAFAFLPAEKAKIDLTGSPLLKGLDVHSPICTIRYAHWSWDKTSRQYLLNLLGLFPAKPKPDSKVPNPSLAERKARARKVKYFDN